MSNKTKNKTIKRGALSENAVHYIMISPFLILFFLFTVLPVISSLGLSFFSYDMISLPKFSGVANYLRMFNGDEVFPKAVVNTLKFAVVTGPLSYLLAYLLAWFAKDAIYEFQMMAQHPLRCTSGIYTTEEIERSSYGN